MEDAGGVDRSVSHEQSAEENKDSCREEQTIHENYSVESNGELDLLCCLCFILSRSKQQTPKTSHLPWATPKAPNTPTLTSTPIRTELLLSNEESASLVQSLSQKFDPIKATFWMKYIRKTTREYVQPMALRYWTYMENLTCKCSQVSMRQFEFLLELCWKKKEKKILPVPSPWLPSLLVVGPSCPRPLLAFWRNYFFSVWHWK